MVLSLGFRSRRSGVLLVAALLCASCTSSSVTFTADLSRTTGLEGSCEITVEKRDVGAAPDRWDDDADALVFFVAGADRERIIEVLEEIPQVARVVTVSAERSLAEWQEMFTSELIETPDLTMVPRRVEVSAADDARGFRDMMRAVELAPEVLAVTERVDVCLSSHLNSLVRCSGRHVDGETLIVDVSRLLSDDEHGAVRDRIEAIADAGAITSVGYVDRIGALQEIADIAGVDLIDLDLSTEDVFASFRIGTDDPATTMRVLSEEFDSDGGRKFSPVYPADVAGSDC